MLKKIVWFLTILVPIFIGYVIYGFVTFKAISPYSGEAPEGFIIDSEENVNFDVALDVFTKSLQCRTVAGNDEEFTKMKDLLRKSFPLVHKHLELVEFDFGLLYMWKGSDKSLEKKPIVLLSHMDVVPVPDQNLEKWTHKNGFSGIIEGGFIWGRGTMDTKGTLVGSMNAVEELLKEGYFPKRPVFLSYGLDEELVVKAYGAKNISEYLKRLNIEPFMIMDEGGFVLKDTFKKIGIESKIAMIGIAEKGYMTLNLSVDCEGGHGSLPPRDPCIYQISKAITNLLERPFSAYCAGEGSITFQGFLNSLFPHASFVPKLVFSVARNFNWMLNLLLSKDKVLNSLIRTTIAPTIIQGGQTENVLPKNSWVVINLRVHPMDSEDDVMKYLRKVINNEKIRIEKKAVVLNDKIASYKTPQYEALGRSIQAVFKDVEIIIPNLLMAGTDLRSYKDLSPFTYNFAPYVIDTSTKDIERIHGVDERISVDNYLKVIQFFKVYIKNMQML